MDYVVVNVFGTILEYFCLWLFFYWVFGKRENISKKVYWTINLVMPLYFLLLSTFVTNITLRSILYAISIALPAVLFNGRMRNKLSFGVIYLVIQIICELLVTMVLVKVHNLTVTSFSVDIYAVGVIYTRILCLIVTVILARLLSRKSFFAFAASKTQLSLLIFIPLVSILTIYTLSDNMLLLNHKGYYRTLAAIIGILLANAALFYVHNEINKQALLKQQLKELNAIQQMQEENLLNLDEINKEIRSLMHDMKHHFLILKGYISHDEKEKGLDYVENLLEDIEEKQLTLTGNSIIDTMLSFKIRQAKEKGIELNNSLFFTLADISAIDVALILANALDNAIEATERISDEVQKVINLSILNRGNYLKIEVTNPITQKITIQNNTIYSTKTNKDEHGFGLRNIHSIAKKNDGEMFISCAEREFKLIVVLNNG